MTSEINRDFYCSAGNYNNLFCKESRSTCIANSCCKNYHRKWLTPEQFKEKYGVDYPADGAVYYINLKSSDIWRVGFYWYKERWGYDNTYFVVCACTPWGKPPADWRPQ